jgi:hypothetical protein
MPGFFTDNGQFCIRQSNRGTILTRLGLRPHAGAVIAKTVPKLVRQHKKTWPAQ